MAKKKELEIEEAVVVEETTNALTVAEKIAESLPAIPEVFFIDGEEYSVPRVKEMEKEADALLKKATPETYSSTAIWEEIKALKNRLVKMRTTPDNKRRELSKPFQDFVKEIKSKTDLVGDAAKKVQDKLDEALTAKENHEAELARQEAEAKARRTEGRKESLRALGGSYDIDSGKFTFGYTPEVVSDMQIMEYDDPTWDNQYAEIKAEWDKEQERLAELKAKEDAEKERLRAEAEEAQLRVLKLRNRLLSANGFTFNEQTQAYTNGTSTAPLFAIKEWTDEQFDGFLDGDMATPPYQDVPEAPAPTAPQNRVPLSEILPPAPSVSGPISVSPQVEKGSGIVVPLVFDEEKPYKDIPLKNVFFRMYPIQCETEAMANVPEDKIKAVFREENSNIAIHVISF